MSGCETGLVAPARCRVGPGSVSGKVSGRVMKPASETLKGQKTRGRKTKVMEAGIDGIQLSVISLCVCQICSVYRAVCVVGAYE